MTVGTRSGGGALRRQECRVPLIQALDEKSSKLEDFWNAKTEVVRNKLDRHGAADTRWIESIAECPVYYPSEEDFMQDPLHYIQKISAQASKFGICKIVSPVVASVPAGIVLSKEQSGFKFTTRVQPLRLSAWDKDDKITFPMSGRIYTLTEYEKMANRIASRKYSTTANLPPRFIESEFWRELAVGKARTVEYATDVEGSAFSSSHTDPLGQSKWNLKGISRLPDSTLHLLEDAIPGVTEPMLYIGMLFSMFSWHIEDHYLYSINYQHCGAPKTWYGVPGDAALCFEKVVREHVYNAELLRDTGKGAELDLLLEKTTMFTPKLLVEQGVPVFKAVQYPGEFIVTFPRAYHAGFSHGFNCGEAVNFAMADWFPLGAEACSRYEFLNRFPLLPHEMLLCKEASIISQINQTEQDSFSCERLAHIKVAFVACIQSLLQSMSSLKRRGAKTTTSIENSVSCGLCKHICYVAYTSCKCFPQPTCFNHGAFFTSCTCKVARMIFLKDDFADLEAVAQKYEREVDIRIRVQNLLLQNDFLEGENGSMVVEDMHFEKSPVVDRMDSGECGLTQSDKEQADNANTMAHLESCDGVMALYSRQGHEEDLSDTEVVQFKRRKVSLPQSKRFQIDEQELAPERAMVLTFNNSDCPKVESSCSSARSHSLKLASLDKQAVAEVAETDKVTVNMTCEPFDTSSDSEVMRKRKKLHGAVAKVKRRRPTATAKDSVLAAEFHVVKQDAETNHSDSRDPSNLALGSTKSIDGGAAIFKDGQKQEIESLSASEEIVHEVKEMEQTPCIENMKKYDFSQGTNDGELIKVDTGVSFSVNKNLKEQLSLKAVRIERDSPVEVAGSSAHETNLTEDLKFLNLRNAVSNSAELRIETDPTVATTGSLTHETNLTENLKVLNSSNAVLNPAETEIETDPAVEITRSLTHETNLTEDQKVLSSRIVISNAPEVDTRQHVNRNKVSNTEWVDDTRVTTPETAISDEGNPHHPDGNWPSCEFRGCETDGFVLKNENFLPAEAHLLADPVEDQEARKNVASSGARSMPLKDCGKSETASVSSLEPIKGLVILLNRKVEQIPKKNVADVLLDEDKSSICENLMEQVDALEGQSGGSAWCLDQEVISSLSDQNDCKQFSPLGPSLLTCSGDLVKDLSKPGTGGEFLEEVSYLKPEGPLLEAGKLIVAQQGRESTNGFQDGFGYDFSKPSPHFESNDQVEEGQICEGESSSTQYSFAMPPLVSGCPSAIIEGEHKQGALENIGSLSCRKSANSHANFCEWQKSEVSSQVASEVTRVLPSAGVRVFRDDYLQAFTQTATRLSAHSSRFDSSNLHPIEGHASNFIEKPIYQPRNPGSVGFELFQGRSMNWSHRRLQGRAEFSSHYSTSHTSVMSNNNHRVRPPNNYKPRSLHRNYYHPQTDDMRAGKHARSFQRRPFNRWERRPRRHYSRGCRGVSLQNDRSSFGTDNLRTKGVFDAGCSAAMSSAGSVEGYDPTKWEISPVANPWQFSSTSNHVPSAWAERRS